MSFSLRDHLFNPDTVGQLAAWISAAHRPFDAEQFVSAVIDPFPELSLKERIAHIAQVLHSHLPDRYEEALAIIVGALPPELDPALSDDDFGDYIIAPLSHFVATYGCEEQYRDISLDALRAITKRFSAEDAIRFFINAFPDETFTFLMQCAEDDNYHVRRLASEGSRPKLPWSSKLAVDHTWPLPILDKLYSDSTRYVTRSVANHVNDLNKIDADLAVSTLKQWQGEGGQETGEMAFLTRHGLRTLVKQGSKPALTLLGYGEAPKVEIINLVCTTPEVTLGEALHFSFDLVGGKNQALLIDYRMHFARPDDRPSAKVFKLKQLEITKGERITITKRHPMRVMTTRRLYRGEHRVAIQINGTVVAEFAFTLVDGSG